MGVGIEEKGGDPGPTGSLGVCGTWTIAMDAATVGATATGAMEGWCSSRGRFKPEPPVAEITVGAGTSAAPGGRCDTVACCSGRGEISECAGWGAILAEGEGATGVPIGAPAGGSAPAIAGPGEGEGAGGAAPAAKHDREKFLLTLSPFPPSPR